MNKLFRLDYYSFIFLQLEGVLSSFLGSIHYYQRNLLNDQKNKQIDKSNEELATTMNKATGLVRNN